MQPIEKQDEPVFELPARVKLPKNRLCPYKLLTMLLYGQYAFAERSGVVGTFRTGPMARLLKVPNSRVREYMEFLQSHQFVEKLYFERGTITYTIKRPEF